jgi:hypothetical protein
VLIFCQTLKNYHIYCFNAHYLKWNRVEWLKFPVNHGSIVPDGLIKINNNNIIKFRRVTCMHKYQYTKC